MTIALQASLSGGELPPSLHGMVDLAWYKNCLKRCRNMIVGCYGGVRNRAGSKLVVEAKDSSSRVRLIPFTYSTEQTYVLEFGAGYIRITYGGVPLTYGATPDPWATTTSYTAGDIRRESGVDYVCISSHTSGVFSTDLVAELWHELTTVDGDPIIELPTDYSEAELLTLNYTQSADVLTVVHPNHPPTQLRRLSATSWTFLAQTLHSGPFQAVNTDTTVSIHTSANVGRVTLTASAALFRAKHVGMLFYLEQKDFGISWLPGVAVNLGDIRRSGGNYYRALTTGTTGQNIPIGTLDHWNDGGVDWQYLHNGFGVATIAEVLSPTSATAVVRLRLPDNATTSSGFGSPIAITGTAFNDEGYCVGAATGHGLALGSYGVCLLTYTTTLGNGATDSSTTYWVVDADHVRFALPADLGDYSLPDAVTLVSFKPPISSGAQDSYKWAFGAFGDPAVGDATYGYGPGFPAAVTYFQQRLWFGGTTIAPDTVWGSKTADYNDFGTSNPVIDSDAISETLASNQVNAIRGLLQLDKLLALTSGAVWALSSGQQADVITPSNIGSKLQSYQGVSYLPPLGVGGTVLYAQDKAQVVRDLNYQWANDAYTGQNLTARGSHLVDGYYFEEWAFQQSPLNVVWMVRNDGALIGLTYLREQEVAAWHRHDTDGYYESVCVVSEGQEDVLYAAVRRTINGATKRFIERFDTRVVTDITDAFFVDCGLTYDNTNTTTATVALSGGTDYDEDELITITATASIFAYPATTDVGDQIVYSVDGVDYKVTITSVTATDTAVGRPVSAIPADLRVATTDWAWARNTLAGLDHLEGKEVAILTDGLVHQRKTVSSGVVTLDYPAVKVQVGLPYVSEVETLPLILPTPETVRSNMKMISTLRVVVNETRSIWAGPNEDALYEAKSREADNNYTPPNLITGVVEVRLASSWDRTGTVLIRHTDPTPIGLLALMPEVSVGGA